MSHSQPKYPVYVISKGRADCCLTAKCLMAEGVAFRLVIEPQEYEAYAAYFDLSLLFTLPFSNLGLGSIPARNWVWQDALSRGAERHWILDDNIRYFYRRYKAEKIYCEAGVALAVAEEFIDRYENIAVGGLNYEMFAPNYTKVKPFQVNCHVYSCLLILNSIPCRWRGHYNEDTDLCLQVLAAGWCTVLISAFLADKVRTMTMKGGNATELYQGDGRLRMARSLERVWPGVAKTDRRFQRPQHVIKDGWKRFDTPLRLKPGIDLTALKANEYGMTLSQVKPEVKTDRLRDMMTEYYEKHSGTT